LAFGKTSGPPTKVQNKFVQEERVSLQETSRATDFR